jgi:hypothetical protein
MDVDDRPVTDTRRNAPSWLLPWLEWLDVGLHLEVLRLRARYELSLDELRGLYVSDEQVDRLLARSLPDPALQAELDQLGERRTALLAAAYDADTPVAHVARTFALCEAELVALVASLAPEVDLGYQTLYGYLNDDLSRRLVTVDLARRLAGGNAVQPDAALVTDGLVESRPYDPAPGWLGTGLVVSEPARRFLLGLDPLAGTGTTASRPGLVLLESRWPQDAAAAARELTRHDGQVLVEPDPQDPDVPGALHRAVLRARLLGAGVYVAQPPAPAEGTAWLPLLVDAPVTVFLGVRPDQVDTLPLTCVDHQRLVVDRPDREVRRDLWRGTLARHGLAADTDDLAVVADLFDLGPGQIAAAAGDVARAGTADRESLTQAARERAGAGFSGLAVRVTAAYTWDDLVLPAGTMRRLRDLQDAVRHRHEVFDAWGLGRLAGGHSSVRALFAGPSGTGKTMSASVIAGELGLELHRVDLSAVVSKYIGETEKNLARVFQAAEDSSAMLFFDEADALFGRRTQVKDAHDRYANIETSYLLQRIEAFDGVVVLATNLAGNLDDAFGRRIQFTVEFPVPDEELRSRLWSLSLPSTAPVAADVDPAFLAGMFPLTGGDIRSAALMAAFAAAGEGCPIGMRHVVVALGRLRRQQGKVPSPTEFGRYLPLVRDEGGDG